MRTTKCTKRTYSTYSPSLHPGTERMERVNSEVFIEPKTLSDNPFQNIINFEGHLTETINRTKKTISDWTKFNGYNFFFNDCENVIHKTKSGQFKFDISEMVRNCFNFDRKGNGNKIRIFWNLNNEVRIELIHH